MLKQIFAQKMGQARSIVRKQSLAARRRISERGNPNPEEFAEYQVAFDAAVTTVTAAFPLASGDMVQDDHFVVELKLFNEIGHLIEPGDLNISYSRQLQSPYAYVKNAAGVVKTQIVSADHQNISSGQLCVRVWKKTAGPAGLDVLGPLLVVGTVEHPTRTITKKATLI